MAEYQNCYVAFLDLLGFKELIKNRSCDEIMSVFQELEKDYEWLCDGEPIIERKNFHKYIMSDSICLYVRSDIKDSLPYLIAMCIQIQCRLLKFDPPILLRGGIAQGDIYFDGTVIFGKGLVDAYLLESNNAVVPRIIITPKTLESCTNYDKVFDVFLKENYIFVDYDAFYALNYLKFFCAFCGPDDTEQIEKVSKNFKEVLGSTTDKSLRDKYLYVNNIIDYHYREVLEWKNNHQQ